MAEEENYNEDESIENIEKEEPINKVDVNSIKPKESKERKLHTRICPCCKQEYKTKIGVDNWKNLFRKPTMEDWITLVILILLLAAAFAYTTETKACKETLTNLDQVCMKRQANITSQIDANPGYVPSFIYNSTNESTSEVNSSNDSGQNLTENIPIAYANYSSNLNNTQNSSNVSG